MPTKDENDGGAQAAAQQQAQGAEDQAAQGRQVEGGAGTGTASGDGAASHGKHAAPGSEAALVDEAGFEAQVAERDARIAELEAQIAAAAKSAEAADELRGQIAELKQQAADERVDFALQMAGCRNAKAARALLGDYGDDVAKLKEAEPWLFAKHAAEPAGATGLPNAGAATDEGRDLKRWRAIAGLDDKTK